MTHEIIPEFEHMRDIIERGPATGPVVDAVQSALAAARERMYAGPVSDRRDFMIEVTRDGKFVDLRQFVPLTEEVARLYWAETCLDYFDCEVVLLDGGRPLETYIPEGVL